MASSHSREIRVETPDFQRYLMHARNFLSTRTCTSCPHLGSFLHIPSLRRVWQPRVPAAERNGMLNMCKITFCTQARKHARNSSIGTEFESSLRSGKGICEVNPYNKSAKCQQLSVRMLCCLLEDNFIEFV